MTIFVIIKKDILRIIKNNKKMMIMIIIEVI